MGLLSCHLSPLVESIGFGKEEEGPKQALQFTACTKTETLLGKKAGLDFSLVIQFFFVSCYFFTIYYEDPE